MQRADGVAAAVKYMCHLCCCTALGRSYVLAAGVVVVVGSPAAHCCVDGT